MLLYGRGSTKYEFIRCNTIIYKFVFFLLFSFFEVVHRSVTIFLYCFLNLGRKLNFIATPYVRSKNIYFETRDHKPDNPLESCRIISNGAEIRQNRINGKLNVSRAFGDFALKSHGMPISVGLFKQAQLNQPVIAVPDVTVLERSHNSDEFIFLGCDGVFDVMNSKQIVELISDRLQVHESSSRISNELIQTCLAKDSRDNIR